MSDNETILHVADLLRDAVRFRHPADGKHVECDFTFPAEWCDLVEKVLRTSAQDARRLVKPAKTLIDESGFGYEEGAIYSSQKAANELSEPDAWLVPWCRANGDAGTNVYVRKSDAENAAKNLEKYSRSETTADVIPLYAHPPAVTEGHGGWQSIDTAPDDGRKIWAFGGRHEKPTIVDADGDWWRFNSKQGLSGIPTHWQPLLMPESPSSHPSTNRGSAA